MSRSTVSKALKAEALLDEMVEDGAPVTVHEAELYYRRLRKLQEEVHGLTAMLVVELDAQEDGAWLKH